jgi:hypothetical protein
MNREFNPILFSHSPFSDFFGNKKGKGKLFPFQITLWSFPEHQHS